MIFLIKNISNNTFQQKHSGCCVRKRLECRTRAEVERNLQSMRKAIVKIHTRNDGNLNRRNSGGDDKQLLNLE